MSLNLIFGYGNQYYFTPVITCPNGLENITAKFKYAQATGSGSMVENVAIGEGALIHNSGPDGNEWYGSSSVPNIAIGNNSLNHNLQGNYNIALGINASHWNTTGINNIAIGHGALYNSTTGSNNIVIGNHNPLHCSQTIAGGASEPISCGDYGSKIVAIGSDVLEYNSGTHSIGIGYQALYNNTTGGSNIGIGNKTLYNNVTGSANTAFGTHALYSNISATYNTAIGMHSLKYTKTSNNIAVGRGAGFNHTGTDSIILGQFTITASIIEGGGTSPPSSPEDSESATLPIDYALTPTNSGSRVISIGNNNLIKNSSSNLIAIGHNALQSNEYGTSNVAIGSYALSNNVNGTNNFALGTNALYANTSGSHNFALGAYTLSANTVSYNVAIGTKSSYFNSTGSSNTGIGMHSLFINTSADNNTGIGTYALKYTTTSGNTAIGRAAGFNHTGIDSVIIGKFDVSATDAPPNPETSETLTFTTLYAPITPSNSGDRVISIGNNNLIQNTSSNLIAIGHNALQLNIGGTSNVAIGTYALSSNVGGSNNVALGYTNLRYNVSGSLNTALGSQVLPNVDFSGNNNTGVGYRALYGVTTGYDNTAIGKGAGQTITSGFNNTVIGSGATASSPTASNEMTLGNGITVLRCGTTTITGISDIRDKTNIEDIPVGLDYINALHPVKFDWNTRDGTKIGDKDFGFIAQELDLIEQQFGYQEYTRLVNKNNPDRLETDYMKTYPILVKAIQELSNKIDLILNHLNLNI